MLWVLLALPCWAGAVESPDAEEPLPDPTLLIASNGEDLTGIKLMIPDGWKAQRKEHVGLVVTWPRDRVPLYALPSHIVKKPLSVGHVGDDAIQVEGTVKMCRKDLCREASFAAHGKGDPSQPYIFLPMEPGLGEPIDVAALDAPDPTGHVDVVMADIAAARASGKTPLLYFRRDGCPPCDQLVAALDRLPAEQLDDRFAMVTIDASDPPLRRFVAQYRSLGTPTLVVLDAEGNPTAHLTGFPGKKAVVAFLDGAVAGLGEGGTSEGGD